VTHEEMADLYELYALDTLEAPERAEIDDHLIDRCPVCLEKLQAALALTSALAVLADPVEPPAHLRDRIAGVSRRSRVSGSTPWRVAWVAVAASVALLGWSLMLRNNLNSERKQVAGITSQRDQLKDLVQLLTSPQTRTARATSNPNAPFGQVFVDPNRGFVFVGSRLPQIDETRTFELWVVPPTGAPQPAGLFRPSAAAEATYVSSVKVNLQNAHAIAVSIEPRAGSNAPTTQPFLIMPLS
jgi:anti-sigma-K factor RskA